MTDRLLDAGEVADLLHVPVSWVRDHTSNGDIPHIQLGRYKRYRQPEILEWVERQAGGGQQLTPRTRGRLRVA